jgi:hypothetical protein
MAKKTYVKLINTVLRELNIAEISDPTIATGQASLVSNYFNDAQHSIYTEEDWYSSYKERIFQTSKDAYISVLTPGSLDSGFTITITFNGSDRVITEGVNFTKSTDASVTASLIAEALSSLLSNSHNTVQDNETVLIKSMPQNDVGITAIATSESDADVLKVSTIDTDTYSLATDFGRGIALIDISTPSVLTPWGFNDFDLQNPDLSATGTPRFYSVQGNNYRLHPVPSSTLVMLDKYWRSPADMEAADDMYQLPIECELPMITWVRWQMSLYLNKSIRAQQLSRLYRDQLQTAKESNMDVIDKMRIVDSGGSLGGRLGPNQPSWPSTYPRGR